MKVINISPKLKLIVALMMITALPGCDEIPDGVKPVSNLDVEKYMGTWHEIARMDSRFEKNLVNVTATYTLMDDGNIRVLNRGYDTTKNKWDEVEGKARSASDSSSSMLEVSFFGPFYSNYNVIALDTLNYEYAMVCGSNEKYLWILARERELEEDILTRLLEQARESGFNIIDLKFVPQEVEIDKR